MQCARLTASVAGSSMWKPSAQCQHAIANAMRLIGPRNPRRHFCIQSLSKDTPASTPQSVLLAQNMRMQMGATQGSDMQGVARQESKTFVNDEVLPFDEEDEEIVQEIVEFGGIVASGIHKGLTYDALATQHPKYCHWILRKVQHGELDHWQHFVKFLYDNRRSVVESLGEDEQDIQPISADVLPGTSEVSFGKYSGRKFQEVLAQDPRYCKWLLQEAEMLFKDECSEACNSFVAFLREARLSDSRLRSPRTEQSGAHGTIASGRWVLTFGKHAGKTFKSVWENDRQYCQWFANEVQNKMRKSTPDALAFAVYVQGRLIGESTA